MLKRIFSLLTISGVLMMLSGCTSADPASQDLPWSGRGDRSWMYTPPGMGGLGSGGN